MNILEYAVLKKKFGGEGGGGGVSTAVINAILDRSITAYENNEIAELGAFALQYCKKLTKLTLGAVIVIRGSSLRDCEALVEVNMPNLERTDGTYSMTSCVSLESIVLPKCTTFGDHTFRSCEKLKFVDLPVANKFGRYVFYGTALEALILRADEVATLNSSDALQSSPVEAGTGYIYVPSALVDSYKAATNWSAYAAQFRALEDYTVDGTVTGALDESKI